ncbi:hypothetical protein [Methyloversatilis sp. XJ19-49]|uniref:hypothetical protein n=1 Tax=Methyloversatilis sp. XJ19-49 TaxID=2963429 RepID=UPI00211C403B|nr:hypothetical protein [Methyloversatilis sp. XJ19-49]MCQ9377914.1 hypothetical protein [Methyloversatilis sp. XJ19-49]
MKDAQMMNTTPQEDSTAGPPMGHGIESLIERLRTEGIDAGRQQAQQFIAQAQAEIDALRAGARAEAEGLLEAARERIRIEQEASLGAIRLAFRDSVLRLKEDFLQQFGERLQRHVQTELADPELLRRLLIALVQPMFPDPAQPSDRTPQTMSMPSEADLEALARDGEARLLSEGLELLPAAQGSGLRICMVAGDMEVHVTDEALSALLLEHLLPKVRRHLDGGPVVHANPQAGGPGTPDDATRTAVTRQEPGT